MENGHKMSYFKFLEEKNMFKKWIVAIRRDVGEYFQVTEHTRVFSRHFKQDDFKLPFAKRKRDLKTTAVPLVFAWRKECPVKRKSPKKRSPIKQQKATKTTKTKATNEETIASVDTIESGDFLSSTCTNVESVSIESKCLNVETNTLKVNNLTKDLQCIIFGLKSANERLSQKIFILTAKQEKLKSQVAELNRPNATLQGRIFCLGRFLESKKDVTFYTGFPKRGVFESVFEFLDPGNEGENIKYWHSESDDFKVNESCGEGSPKQGRPRQLKPMEDFF